MSGKAKHLNESQRLEVISKLSQTNPPSKQSIAWQYKVSDATITIRNVWTKREVITKRSALKSEEMKKKKFRASVRRFKDMEYKFYL